VRTGTKRWVPAVVMVGLVAAGCSSASSPESNSTTTTTTTTSEATETITVSAAASLTEAFTEIGADFEKANPGATATFNFGSSGTLSLQIQQGAAADTFASADGDNMDKLVTDSLIDRTPVVFATNELVVVTKPGNPESVETLADLPNLGVVALCGETVPCGKYAAQILQGAAVTIPETKVTRGTDVKTTLAAVTAGDADAAIVYVTDAESAGDTVDTVTIPGEQNAVATYPIATLKASGSKATSQAFIDYVMSSKGQATLESFGFLPPS
jgi:molybdate transport system substrate-binding protein